MRVASASLQIEFGRLDDSHIVEAPWIQQMERMLEVASTQARERSRTLGASVATTNDFTEFEDSLSEMLLFVCFCLRQAANFGFGDPAFNDIALALDKSYDVITSIARDSRTELGRVEAELAHKMGMDELGYRLVSSLNSFGFGTPRLVEKYGIKLGGFKAILTYNASAFQFKCKPIGLRCNSDIGFYAPTALFVLLRYLVRLHDSDPHYLQRIGGLCKACSLMMMHNRVAVKGQLQLAMILAGTMHECQIGEVDEAIAAIEQLAPMM